MDHGDSADDRRARWDERHAAHDPIESTEPDPTVVATCAGLEPGRALDLGSGDGRNAVWLAQQGWRVTAVDFSGVAIDRARTRAIGLGVAIDWRQEDLLVWRPEPGAFDLVLLAFIHLPSEERRGVYEGAAAAVTDGGTLLVVGHDRANLGRGTGGPQDPDVLFTPGEITGALPAGFVVERAETVVRATVGPAPIDAIVVARRVGAG